MNASINPLVYEGDYLSNFLLLKCRLPIWLLPLIMAIIGILFHVGLSSALGHLRTESSIVGSLDVPGMMIIELIIQPVIVAYYLWLPKIAISEIGSLDNNDVIQEHDKNAFSSFLNHLASSLGSKRVSQVSLGIAVIITAQILVENLNRPVYWGHHYPLLAIYLGATTLITVYSFSQIIIRVFIIQWDLDKLYNKIEIHVQPLHPDDAGGLVCIGYLIRTYIYWVLPAGIFVAGVGISHYAQKGVFPVYTYILFALLPIVTVLAFFLPMRSTHRAMLRSLEKELIRLNTAFEMQVQTGWKTHDLELESKLQSIDQIIETSTKLKKVYPTWPFNSRLLRRFSISLLASMVPIGFAILEGFVINLFVPQAG